MAEEVLIDDEDYIEGSGENFEIGRQMFRDKVLFTVVNGDPRPGILAGYVFEGGQD